MFLLFFEIIWGNRFSYLCNCSIITYMRVVFWLAHEDESKCAISSRKRSIFVFCPECFSFYSSLNSYPSHAPAKSTWICSNMEFHNPDDILHSRRETKGLVVWEFVLSLPASVSLLQYRNFIYFSNECQPFWRGVFLRFFSLLWYAHYFLFLFCMNVHRN